MKRESNPLSALLRAIQIAGGQTQFGELHGKRQSVVSDWVNKLQHLPAEFVLATEAKTGVPCWELRPDLYPPERFSSSHGRTGAGASGSPATTMGDGASALTDEQNTPAMNNRQPIQGRGIDPANLNPEEHPLGRLAS